MSKYLWGLVVITALAGCSREPSGELAGGGDVESGVEEISGPFPKTVRGTIGYSYPLDDEGGPVKFDLLEYGGATFIISAADYDAKDGIHEDDAEISVTEPSEARHAASGVLTRRSAVHSLDATPAVTVAAPGDELGPPSVTPTYRATRR